MTSQPESGWLSPVLGLLDRAEHPVRFFFRNDDVGWDMAALRPLLDAFDVRRLPLDMAVIPCALDEATARELVDRSAASGGRMRLHQHGWSHENHEPVGRKCEFGPNRAAADQEADIRAGYRRLQAIAGTAVDPIFTPPWNRCEPATARLLETMPFRVLSRDARARPLPAHGLVELPISVDWGTCGRGEGGWAGLARQISAAASGGRPIGIMLHHAEMDEASRRGLDQVLDLLARHPNAVCQTMMACVSAATVQDT